MAFATVQSWSETPASNTEIDGINIDEGCNPSGINNAIRELMAQVAAWTGDDTIASATTTDLSTVNGQFVSITGTTTITGFGTVKAGWVKFLHFAGALTLTHNATSMILPGGNNITTVAGDTAVFVSLGSGNWRCLVPPGYISLSAANTWTANQTFSSTATGATGPVIALYHNTTSPAVSDVVGDLQYNGKDAATNDTTYARIAGTILDPTNLTEDGSIVMQVMMAGTLTTALTLSTAATFGVPARFPDGTVSAPSITFTNDTNTGFYSVSADAIGVAVGGSEVARFTSTGLAASYVTQTANAVGTYGFLCNDETGIGSHGPGGTVAGTSLLFAGLHIDNTAESVTMETSGTVFPSGTWQCMGRMINTGAANEKSATLWVRTV